MDPESTTYEAMVRLPGNGSVRCLITDWGTRYSQVEAELLEPTPMYAVGFRKLVRPSQVERF